MEIVLGWLTWFELFLSEIPPSVPKRDIVDGRCRCAVSRWGDRIKVIGSGRRATAREGLVIRPPGPEGSGEDSQALLAEMTSLETSGGVP